MHVFDFLESADGTPLTKSFIRVGDAYDVIPYPHVRLFNSYRFAVASMAELFPVLVEQAALQRCLLKGALQEQLLGTSRMGMTNPAHPTAWVCADMDFSDGWESVEHFVSELDPALKDVTYIFHHSASAGVTSPKGLRGHVLFALEQPVLPMSLKLWLRACNLNMPNLAERITLAANGLSLKWPLDISTCQNDKLLYIAPPTCTGFEDPAPDRFELIEKAKPAAPPLKRLDNLTPAEIDQRTAEKLAELRDGLGLPRAKPKYKNARGVDYLANPDQTIITGVKQARGFTYINLNDGDSWAYYFPDDNPEFVHNFKGEPVVRLRDIAPDFYAELRNAQVRKAKADRDFVPMVFRDRNRDAYYNVLHYPHTGVVEYAKVSNTQKLQHFMLQYNETPPEIIEDWLVEFNPTRTDTIDVHAKWMNTFKPTPFILSPNPRPDAALPPVIGKLVFSMCGSDPATVDHYLNWLAYAFQTRRKIGTAWVFHGVSGTGKGLFLSRVLKVIFGPAHVLEYTAQQIEDQFNAGLETACILAVDEFHHESARSSGTVMNKLKSIITEERIGIRGMRAETVMCPSFVNVVIFSNHPDPVYLATHDRRFNVSPAQEIPLRMTTAEIESIDEEIPEFVSYLASYKVDVPRTRQILLNDARTRMIAASQTSIERLFEALRMGDLQYFLEFAPIKMPMMDTLLYNAFVALVSDWANDAKNDVQTAVTLDDIRTAYHYIIGTPTSPAKLRRMLAVYRVNFSAAAKGIIVRWGVEPEALDTFFEQRPKLLNKDKIA